MPSMAPDMERCHGAHKQVVVVWREITFVFCVFVIYVSLKNYFNLSQA